MRKAREVMAFLRRRRVARILAAAFSVAIFVLALWVLHRTVGRFDAQEIAATARAYDGESLVVALILVLGSYAALSGFDVLGIVHLRKTVPIGWSGLISFVSHAISHNAGFAVLTGGSVRVRMYSAFGLGVAEVAGIVAFAGLTFILGASTLGAIAFVTEATKVAALLRLPEGAVMGLGGVIAAILVVYVVLTAVARRPLAVGMWRVSTPSLGMSLAQIAIAALDLALVAGALYVLLPLKDVSYPAFVGLYVVATLAGTLSHVPGGLGVFEGALVLLLPELETSALLAALLLFRVFYNLVPLLLGALVLVMFEISQRLRHAADPPWLRMLGPPLGALMVFGGGVVLLVTGAAPSPTLMPRWVAEPAHLVSGAVGALLLGIPWGLLRQADWAYRAALAGLGLGAVTALLRGPDWVGAGVMAAGAATLVAAAPLFHHGVGGKRPPLEWLGAAAAVVGVAFWLTWHADTDGWRIFSFASNDEGARAMRANITAAASLVAIGWASWRNFHIPDGGAPRPGE